ncbi:hypothetical protein BDZ45DRAFT_205647 [Acephala macrosclerotiorum]|nr:hypothetical protein BDZ45DRAFT_205647 [Acephala macrosclerotiorum]
MEDYSDASASTINGQPRPRQARSSQESSQASHQQPTAYGPRPPPQSMTPREWLLDLFPLEISETQGSGNPSVINSIRNEDGFSPAQQLWRDIEDTHGRGSRTQDESSSRVSRQESRRERASTHDCYTSSCNSLPPVHRRCRKGRRGHRR